MDDQISSPTWARTLAEATAQVIAQGRCAPIDYIQEKRGIYNLAGGGSCSRYEWAKAILEVIQKNSDFSIKKIYTALSTEFPTSAPRPLITPLFCKKIEQILIIFTRLENFFITNIIEL